MITSRKNVGFVINMASEIELIKKVNPFLGNGCC